MSQAVLVAIFEEISGVFVPLAIFGRKGAAGRPRGHGRGWHQNVTVIGTANHSTDTRCFLTRLTSYLSLPGDEEASSAFP